jgi:hypothetical protein
MRRVATATIGLVVALAPFGGVHAAGAAAEAHCTVTGAGTTNDGSRFRVHAKVTPKGEYTGRVRVVSSSGDRFVGSVGIVQCRRDGGGGPGAPAADVNIGDIEGFGSLNGVPGYEFVGSMHDHGEGNLTDRLEDDFRLAISLGGPILRNWGGLLEEGNVQVHPPNRAHP